MGKITINELHKSLYNYAQAVSDENLMTESKTIVNAINEIYGKQLIANAIGEPLNDTDTFTEMSNDINGLLSTFKTNMMNNGVTVENGDKFKQLIDKIATMVEEGSGKGIQFASEAINVLFKQDDALGGGAPFKLTLAELDFEPSIVFIETEEYNNNFIVISSTYHTDIDPGYLGVKPAPYAIINTTATSKQLYISVVLNGNKIDIDYKTSFSPLNYNLPIIYYAIGVGEEDTTLSGGLDIISATELPATGRKNQICVVTDNPVDIFRITPNVDYVSNDGNEIVVYTGTPYTSGLHSGYFLTSGLDNNITEYYFDKIIQNSERKNSYIYINSTWEQMTKAYISWLENGIFMNSELFGGHTNNLWFTINSEGITFKPDTSFTTNVGIATTNRIDFTVYNKVSLKIKTNNLAGNLYLMAVDSISRLNNDSSETSLSNLTSYAGTKHQSNISLKANDTLYYDIDISGWSGNYYLAIVYSSSKVNDYNTNYNITVIDALVH